CFPCVPVLYSPQLTTLHARLSLLVGADKHLGENNSASLWPCAALSGFAAWARGSHMCLWSQRVRPPVPVELADVGCVRDLEQPASVGVDGVEVALPGILVAAEGNLLPVRRPDRVETPERRRVGGQAATRTRDRKLPQARAVEVNDPDRAVVIAVGNVG